MAIAVLGLIAAPALADCTLTGSCEAVENTVEPELGLWQYTLTVDWDTGTQHGLSHLDLLMGYENHNCECDQFSFAFPDTAGSSEGERGAVSYKFQLRDDPCTVFYEGFFECWGDPSIPGVYEPLLKFEPYEGDGCEPGPVGSMTVVFYSDWEPVPVMMPNEWLVIKFAGYSCFGQVDGVLPQLDCIHTAAESADWSGVKSKY